MPTISDVMRSASFSKAFPSSILLKMAARKLQTEIDKTLKKVTEGVTVFEDIHEKLMLSTNQTQKDKLETDLKTQIKKLQRLRDQIKTWQASNDIKDKGPLLDNRKLIETQMERFKALEKEMKTKAFSKEGLILAAKLDPSQQAKLAARHLLEDFVDSLNRQIEQDEAEIEVLQAAGGGGKKKTPKGPGGALTGLEKLSELERQNERRSWHVSKLESILRLLENDSLTTEQATGLKEDVSYFVESNQEEDFEEDEGIYDDLNLDELEGEDGFGVVGNLQAGQGNGLFDDDDSVSDLQSVNEEQMTPAKALPPKPRRGSSTAPPTEILESSTVGTGSAPSSPVAQRKTPVRKNTLDSKSPNPVRPTSGNVATASIPPVPPIPAAIPPARQPAVSLPPLKYAAAASGAVASAPTPSTPAPTSLVPAPPPILAHVQTTPQPPPGIPTPVEAARAPSPSPSLAPPPGIPQTLPSPAPHHLGSPAPSSSIPAVESRASPAPSHRSAGVNGMLATADPSDIQGLTAGSTQAGASTSPATPHQLPTLQSVNAQSQAGAAISSSTTNGASATVPPPVAESSAQGARAAAAATAQAQPPAVQHGPNALSDLMNNFEHVKQRSVERLADIDSLHGALETGLASAPEARDSERPRYYHPRQPYQTPSYYPQQPHPVLDNKNLYQRMELDTLFFIFYYRTNTYEQWCAAQELKRQSWRFHKQYLTWFQRLSQPQAITDEYEQGQYIYFDWENGFNCRKKSDFRFSYQYLCED